VSDSSAIEISCSISDTQHTFMSSLKDFSIFVTAGNPKSIRSDLVRDNDLMGTMDPVGDIRNSGWTSPSSRLLRSDRNEPVSSDITAEFRN